MRRTAFAAVLVTMVFCASTAWSANIYVSPGASGGAGTIADPADLQTALDMARTNGQPDEILLQTGTYSASGGAFTFDTSGGGDNDEVFVRGGWNSTYDSMSYDSSLTVLDGGGTNRVISIATDTGFDFSFGVENLTVSNGAVTGESGGGILCIQGGGAVLFWTDFTVFSGNTSGTGNGGAVSSSCSFEVHAAAFSGNSGSSGGALYLWGGASQPTWVDQSRFDNNVNTGNQGHDIWSNTDLLVTGSSFTGVDGGDTSGAGSAVWANSGSFLTVENSSFKDISIQQWGSAIQGFDAGADITNCLFADNTAGTGNGDAYGAVAFTNISGGASQITITNSTFTGNQNALNNIATALDVRGDNVTIVNSVFWDNEGMAGIRARPFTTTPVATVSFSDLQGGVDGSFTEGGGNIDMDPLLTADHMLTSGSPCVDGGTNGAANLPGEDSNHDARVIDGDGDGTATADMGWDEYNPGAAPRIWAEAGGFRIFDYLPLSRSAPLVLKVSMQAGSLRGTPVDWWMVIRTPFPPPNTFYHYDFSSRRFVPGLDVTYQSALGNLKPFEVLDMSRLPTGTYIGYFGIDTVANGRLDFGQFTGDTIVLDIDSP